MVRKFDFIVIGSGIAGMSFALKVANYGKVAILCKTKLTEANTNLAQGGIASVTNPATDNFDKHVADTLIAGDGICNEAVVRKVVEDAPREITELVKEHNIPVIFTEVNGSDATAKAIVRETGCAIAQLSMCMDGPDDDLSNYLNAMLGNMAAIVNGFAGEEVVAIQ